MKLIFIILCTIVATLAGTPGDVSQHESKDLNLIKNLSEEIRQFSQEVKVRKDAFLKKQNLIFEDAAQQAAETLMDLLNSTPAKNNFDESKCKALVNITVNHAFSKLVRRPYQMCQFHSDQFFQSFTHPKYTSKLRTMERELVNKNKGFDEREVEIIRNKFVAGKKSYELRVKEMEDWIKHCTFINKEKAVKLTVPWMVFVELFQANCISEFCTPYTNYCLRESKKTSTETSSSQDLAEKLFTLMINIDREIKAIENTVHGEIYDYQKEENLRNVVEGLLVKSDNQTITSRCKEFAKREVNESIDVARNFMKDCYLTSKKNLQRQRKKIYEAYQALENQTVNNIDNVVHAFSEYNAHKSYYIHQCLDEATARMEHYTREVTLTSLHSCIENFCTTPFNDYCLDYVQ